MLGKGLGWEEGGEGGWLPIITESFWSNLGQHSGGRIEALNGDDMPLKSLSTPEFHDSQRKTDFFFRDR